MMATYSLQVMVCLYLCVVVDVTGARGVAVDVVVVVVG